MPQKQTVGLSPELLLVLLLLLIGRGTSGVFDLEVLVV